MIFGINTTSEISKLLYIISRAFGRVKFETILKYHEWIYAKYHVQIVLLFVYTTTHTRFVIFTRRYFKLSRNTIALSQSNCRNLSCGSVNHCKFTDETITHCGKKFLSILFKVLLNYRPSD